MSLDCRALQEAVDFFSPLAGNDVDPLTVLAEILDSIAYSRGTENLFSVREGHSKECILSALKKRVRKARREIESENMEDAYFSSVWFDEDLEYEELVEQGKGYNPKIFFRAIDALRKRGVDVYLTNFRGFEEEIWQEYAKYVRE